ncbi:MAG: transglycosylase domain-containing protein [Rectinemataceae bacterium]|jgi:penicillin-binding protein 1C
MRSDLLPCIASASALALLFSFAVPTPRFPGGLSVALYARRGELLGAAVSSSGQWCLPSSTVLPERFVRALTAYEDKRFFSHAGIDPAALFRAALQNARAGRIVSGGSTISMQAARLGRPDSERTMGEKAVEALMAIRLELLRGKMGILRLYSENAPFGGNVVGIEAASFRFFGRAPLSLSWAEAATLAVLPNSPSAAHPGKNRALLQSKRDRLLRSLARSGGMSGEDLALALAEPLPPEPYPLPRLAPQLVDRFAVPGRVETTLDASLQEKAAEILERRVGRLAAGGVHNGACIVARVDSGEVLAYVANVSPSTLVRASGSSRGFPVEHGEAVAHGDSELGASASSRGEGDRALAGVSSRGFAMAHGESVDLIRAERSSGSLFKPFLYAAALEAGELGPRSLLPDLPTRYGSYEPENNLGGYSGAVRADEALARSLNVPFVRLLKSFGVERFRDLLASTGMSTLRRRAEDYGLTLILGGAETSLWEMAGRFAALARTASSLGPATSRAGARAGASQVFDLGLTRAELDSRARRPDPFSPGSATLTLDALTKVARPEEEAAWEDYASARRIAWKTGTSYGYRDAWAIGVDGTYVAGVWVGNASGEGRPSLKGSAAAAPILFELFGLLAAGGAGDAASSSGAAGGGRDAAAPPALREMEVCADSGWAAGPDCARVETALVPAAVKSLPLCPYCASVAISADGRYRVRAEEEAPGNVRIEKRFVLPPAIERYYARSLGYKSLPPWKPGSAQSGSDRSLAVVAPEEGASLYIPVEITGRPGAAVFTVAHRDAKAVVFWQLDGIYLGSTRGVHAIEVRPGAGEHLLTVVDGAGRSVSRRFTVLSEK